MKFRLYWFNTRTGYGHPALAYPDAMSYEQAHALTNPPGKCRPRHPKNFHCELHHEPESLFEEQTCKHEAL